MNTMKKSNYPATKQKVDPYSTQQHTRDTTNHQPDQEPSHGSNSEDQSGLQRPGNRLMKKGQTTKVKTDTKRVIIEPKELVHNVDTSQSAEEKDTLTIRNVAPSPIYFQTKSTNLNNLRPNPHSGFIPKFDNQEIAVIFKILKATAKLLKSKEDRLTFEWIRLDSEASKKDSIKYAKMLHNTPKEDRYKRSVPIKYRFPQLNNVTNEDIATVKNALTGTPPTVTMVGDFESEKVEADLILMNKSPKNIIWHITQLNNVLLTANPENGILRPNKRAIVTITTKQFHVGSAAGISDHAFVEWTAAAPGLTEFTTQAIEDVPKVFRLRINIFYEYTGVNENTQRSESYRQNTRVSKPQKRLGKRLLE